VRPRGCCGLTETSSATAGELSAGRDHRLGALAHGLDDLGVIDPAEVPGRDGEIGMLDMWVIWELSRGSRDGRGWSGLSAGFGYAVGA
jgi:hypothetical protein